MLAPACLTLLSAIEALKINFFRAAAAWPRNYKTFFMLNSTEHETVPAHKC